jgi:hypothetical protein
MATEKKPSGSPERIPWHPAFVQAMRLELERYNDVLEFISESQLTSEPLRIDLVIIIKEPGIAIDKNIARIFKRVNILEYKSPEDYISVRDFFKVQGYAALYASLNGIDIEDMTVSLIGTRHPEELFKYLAQNKRYTVTEESPGIYRIAGGLVDMQVIESGKLPLEENLWLKALNRGLNAETASVILKEGEKRNKDPNAAAYIYAVLLANAEILEEALKMDKTGETTLDEVLERMGLVAKWEARGKAIGEAQGRVIGEKTAWEKFVSLMEQGYTADELKRMAPAGVPPFTGGIENGQDRRNNA